MKKFLYILTAFTLLLTVSACSDNDEPDPGLIWDIRPAGVTVYLVDEEGNNLLDPAVEGNWVGEPMWISYDGKAYNPCWKEEDLPRPSRFYLAMFYGAVWTGVWSDQHYSLYFGQFQGEDPIDLKLTFGITATNTVYDFEYSHRLVWKKKEPHFDDHIIYKGKKIEGNTLTLTVPRNTK
ncbi:MAG: hypothetical protein K2K55_05600 [Duncaniella sp.]|nr:hypothetical protein [Duncaniella sp.]